MKRAISAILALGLLLTGCGVPLHINDKEYPTYGLFNEASNKSKDVCYEISVGNTLWSLILVETIIAPIYFIGFSLYNPVRLKKNPTDECTYDS